MKDGDSFFTYFIKPAGLHIVRFGENVFNSHVRAATVQMNYVADFKLVLCHRTVHLVECVNPSGHLEGVQAPARVGCSWCVYRMKAGEAFGGKPSGAFLIPNRTANLVIPRSREKPCGQISSEREWRASK